MSIADTYYSIFSEYINNNRELNKIRIDNKLIQSIIDYLPEFYNKNINLTYRYDPYSLFTYISIFLSALINKSSLKEFEIYLDGNNIYPFLGSFLLYKTLKINAKNEKLIVEFLGYKSYKSTFILNGTAGIFTGAYSVSSKFIVKDYIDKYVESNMIDGEIIKISDFKYL
ncbi:hypothetical protein YN1_5230 [Nanoarchaeota archaeon]